MYLKLKERGCEIEWVKKALNLGLQSMMVVKALYFIMMQIIMRLNF